MLEELQDELSYDPESGHFYWIKPKTGRPQGRPAGYTTHQGYRNIRIGAYVFLAHRLAFFFMTGLFPPEFVDHIDGNPSNNAWHNLRLANAQQNAWNKRRKYDSFTGAKGIRKNSINDTWEVQISHEGKLLVEGPFFSYQAACKRYDFLAKQIQGEFYKPEVPRQQIAKFKEVDVQKALEDFLLKRADE